MDAWAHAKAEAEKASNGGNFVRLQNDGDKVVGAFVGAPHVKKIHWDGPKSVECTERPDCPGCLAALPARTRMLMNLYVPEVRAMRIMEGNPEWFRDVITLRDKYGFDKWTFEIVRRGAKGDPKTKYMMLPDKEISADLKALIQKTPLLNMAGKPPSSATSKGAPLEGGAGVDEVTLRGLADRLRAFEKVDVQAFLEAFQIRRLRELRPADLDDATTYIAQLEARAAGVGDATDDWAA